MGNLAEGQIGVLDGRSGPGYATQVRALIPATQANTHGDLSSGTPWLCKSVAAGSVKLGPWSK